MAGSGDKTPSRRSNRLFDGPGDDPFAGLPAGPAERAPGRTDPPPEPSARASSRPASAPARESAGGLGALRRRGPESSTGLIGRRGPTTSQRPTPFKASALPTPDDLTAEGEPEPPRRLSSLPPPPPLLQRLGQRPSREMPDTPRPREGGGFALLPEDSAAVVGDEDAGDEISEPRRMAIPVRIPPSSVGDFPDDGATEELAREPTPAPVDAPAPMRITMPAPSLSPEPAMVEPADPEPGPAPVSPLLARARAASARTMAPTTLAAGSPDPAGPHFPTAPQPAAPLAARLAQAAGPTPLAMPRPSLAPRSGTDPGSSPGGRPSTDSGLRRTPKPGSDPGLHGGGIGQMPLRPTVAPTAPAAPQPAPAARSMVDVERSLQARVRRRRVAVLATAFVLGLALLAVFGPSLPTLLAELRSALVPPAAVVPAVTETPPPPEEPVVAEVAPPPEPRPKPVAPVAAPAPPPQPAPVTPTRSAPAPTPTPTETQPAPVVTATTAPVDTVERGVLVVRSTPKGKVFIDSRPYGYTPVEKELEARTYTVRVIVAGYGTEERTVRVDPGRAAEVNVSFR